MKGIKQILESKDMLGLFKGRLGLLGLLPSNTQKNTLTKFEEIKESSEKFKEKYGRTLDQDFFNEHYQMNFGEDEEKLYNDLVITGLLDFVDEDELKDFIKKAKEKGDNQ